MVKSQHTALVLILLLVWGLLAYAPAVVSAVDTPAQIDLVATQATGCDDSSAPDCKDHSECHMAVGCAGHCVAVVNQTYLPACVTPYLQPQSKLRYSSRSAPPLEQPPRLQSRI